MSNLTIREALDRAIPLLGSAGVETPRLDAELLLGHVLFRTRTQLYAHPGDVVSAEQRAEFDALIARRAAREPLPYLLGDWEWMGLPFRVTPAVLIPRPETETLVEEAARRLPPDARILDVGAGSGCISVGLATLLPRARITALEPSSEAWEVARGNVFRFNLEDRIEVLLAGWPEAAPALGPFEALVSNPPYVPTAEVEVLAPELRLHEPRRALDGGPDGLDLIRSLAEVGPALLVPGGLLALEVGAGQAPAVRECLGSAGVSWTELETVRDLAGVERVVLARRSA